MKWFNSKMTKLSLMVAGALSTLLCFAGASADTPTVQSAMTAAATTIADDAMGGMAAVLPIIIKVVGFGIVAILVIKFIKRLVGKA